MLPGGRRIPAKGILESISKADAHAETLRNPPYAVAWGLQGWDGCTVGARRFQWGSRVLPGPQNPSKLF